MRAAWYYGATGLVGLALRLRSVIVAKPSYLPGSVPYIDIAQQPITSPGFYNTTRGLFVPLVYKILRTTPSGAPAYWTMLAQTAFAALCWTVLAYVVATRLRCRWLRPLAFVAILWFSLSADIVVWDGELMSESWSLSLFALLAAAFLWLTQRDTPLPRSPLLAVGWLVALAALMLAWCFTRDSNVYVLVSAAVLTLVLGYATKTLRRYLPLAVTLVGVSFVANWSVDAGKRWEGGLLNIFGYRILPNTTLYPDPESLPWFISHGMPDSPAFRAMAGVGFTDPRWHGAALAAWFSWFEQHGRQEYALFLATHPRFTLLDWLDHVPMLLSPFYGDRWALGSSPSLPGPLDAVMWPESSWFFLWTILVVALAALYARRVLDRRWLLAIGLALLAIPNSLVSWHGDTVDVERHQIGANVEFRIALLMVGILTIEALAPSIEQAHRAIPARAAAALLAYAVLAVALVGSQLFPSWGLQGATELRPPFHFDTGYAYIASGAPPDGDNLDYLSASPLTLYEDGLQLGPPHTGHDVIRSVGKGGFSHWKSLGIWFSTSDNSSPNSNGRHYTYREPWPYGLNLIPYLAASALVVGLLWLVYVRTRGHPKKSQAAIHPSTTAEPSLLP